MNKKIFNDKKIVIASHNKGKVNEIKDLLKPLNIDILSANNFKLKEPIENGLSFEKNALIKSSYVCKNTGIPSLSDDSGISTTTIENLSNSTQSQVVIPASTQDYRAQQSIVVPSSFNKSQAVSSKSD